MLCILHDLNLALHYFDKLLVLSGGEVAAYGPPDDVLRPDRRHGHRFDPQIIRAAVNHRLHCPGYLRHGAH